MKKKGRLRRSDRKNNRKCWGVKDSFEFDCNMQMSLAARQTERERERERERESFWGWP